MIAALFNKQRTVFSLFDKKSLCLQALDYLFALLQVDISFNFSSRLSFSFLNFIFSCLCRLRTRVTLTARPTCTRTPLMFASHVRQIVLRALVSPTVALDPPIGLVLEDAITAPLSLSPTPPYRSSSDASARWKPSSMVTTAGCM